MAPPNKQQTTFSRCGQLRRHCRGHDAGRRIGVAADSTARMRSVSYGCICNASQCRTLAARRGGCGTERGVGGGRCVGNVTSLAAVAGPLAFPLLGAATRRCRVVTAACGAAALVPFVWSGSGVVTAGAGHPRLGSLRRRQCAAAARRRGGAVIGETARHGSAGRPRRPSAGRALPAARSLLAIVHDAVAGAAATVGAGSRAGAATVVTVDRRAAMVAGRHRPGALRRWTGRFVDPSWPPPLRLRQAAASLDGGYAAASMDGGYAATNGYATQPTVAVTAAATLAAITGLVVVATALPAMGRSLPPRRPAPCEAMTAARRLWSWWACCLYESSSYLCTLPETVGCGCAPFSVSYLYACEGKKKTGCIPRSSHQ